MASVALGAIADDSTGATDLANSWVKEGLRVVQVIGAPDAATEVGEADAVVVALKSRTAPVDAAISQSLAALDWLRAAGAQQIVFKYCSTFDSTPHGNIGPVADALLEALGTDFALLCPAFPENGRTIYRGHLFVGDLLLSDSSMKDHPLTPMRDASLIRLMDAQSRHRTGLVALEHVRAGPAAIRARIEALRAEGLRYAAIDALTDADLRSIGAAAFDHPLVTGGSGVAIGLPDNLRRTGALGAASAPLPPAPPGRELVLAGSCSTATRAQIDAIAGRWPLRRLDPDALAEDAPGEVASALIWAREQPAGLPVAICSSATPEEVARVQARHGAARAGETIERAFAMLAAGLAQDGFTRIAVAGGETSGAVLAGLGVRALGIGPEIAPGVPWTRSLGPRPLALALKSGNFGPPSFFADAFAMLP